MKKVIAKFAVLGVMGALFAIPAASQASGLRLNIGGLHLAIGSYDRPAPVYVRDCDRDDWRRDRDWRRDHDRDWRRDHDRDWRHDRR